MTEQKYPHLFTPIQIGGVTFKNRIAASPVGYNSHRMNDHTAGDFYGFKARGGASAVTIGQTTVDSEHGIAMDGFLPLDTPDCITTLAVLADSIKKHGAFANLELIHPGRYAIQSFYQGNDIYSSVGGEVHGSMVAMNAVGVVAKTATDEDIYRIVDKFAILEMMPMPNFGDNMIHGGALMGAVMQCGIQMALGTRALEITEAGIVGQDAEGIKTFEADTVISALGMKPLTQETDEIRFCAPEFYEVGNSLGIGTIAKATCEGHYAALNIGL